MRTSRPERIRAFDYLGRYRYFLTFCTQGRRRHFAHADVVTLVRTQTRRAATEEGFAISAYCYMPDHVHLLVTGLEEQSDGRRFIKAAKQYSGYVFARSYGDRLWQRYGYERVLRSDEATLAVARYIVNNPLRANLVKEVRQYPFLGSDVYELDAVLEAVGAWCPPRPA